MLDTQVKVWLPVCSNVYDDITDFEICGFHKNKKPRYLEHETVFAS